MCELKIIRKNYKPIQPVVSFNDNCIHYQEIQSNKEIKNFIYCFWQLKTRKKLNKNYYYRVVSDGCIDVFFNRKQLNESFVMGFHDKYTQFEIGKKFDYIGIRFFPSAFPHLFGIDAKTLSNTSKELKEVLPFFSNWINLEIKSYDPFETIVETLSEIIISFSKNRHIHYDHRFIKSLKLILTKNGYLNINKDLNVGLSPRQLRRIFNYYIGTTPKSFSNVIRFQYILNARLSKQDLKENKIYFDVGFYDQAHFINNFKTFYGITPSEAFL